VPAARVRPREAGLRQGVAHVAGEAVDEVVLAAVGFVGDDDDAPAGEVAPVRKHGVPVARLGGHELLDGREDDATAGDAELLAQVGPIGGHDGPGATAGATRPLIALLPDPVSRRPGQEVLHRYAVSANQ
jgi:hypothetical protein